MKKCKEQLSVNALSNDAVRVPVNVTTAHSSKSERGRDSSDLCFVYSPHNLEDFD